MLRADEIKTEVLYRNAAEFLLSRLNVMEALQLRVAVLSFSHVRTCDYVSIKFCRRIGGVFNPETC